MPTRITGARQAGEQIRRQLTSVVTRQIRYAGFLALNDTVKAEREHLQKVMRDRYLDRPTPFTVKGVMYEPAKYEGVRSGQLSAAVYVESSLGKSGRPVAKYLQWQTYGGARRAKAFEIALRAVGVLFPDEFIVPTSGVNLDRYGNIPASFIRLILSYFKAAERTLGYKANLSERRRRSLTAQRKYYIIDKNGRRRLVKTKVLKGDTKRPGFNAGAVSGGAYKYATTLGTATKQYGGQSFGRLFVARYAKSGSFSHLKPGIYSSTGVGGSNVKPLLLFVRQPLYGVRFPFHKIVEGTAPRFLRNAFRKRLEQALATTKAA